MYDRRMGQRGLADQETRYAQGAGASRGREALPAARPRRAGGRLPRRLRDAARKAPRRRPRHGRNARPPGARIANRYGNTGRPRGRTARGRRLTSPMVDPGEEVPEPELPTEGRVAPLRNCRKQGARQGGASTSLRKCSSQSSRFAVACRAVGQGREDADGHRQFAKRVSTCAWGSKSARSCNCIVQGMSGRGAAGHLAGRWRPVSQRGTAAFSREPSTYSGRWELGEEAS
jgi:hypothetical protein